MEEMVPGTSACMVMTVTGERGVRLWFAVGQRSTQSTSISPEADLDCGPPLVPAPCWAVGPLGAWPL